MECPICRKKITLSFDGKKVALYCIPTLILCWLLHPFIGGLTVWLFLILVLAPAAFLGKWL